MTVSPGSWISFLGWDFLLLLLHLLGTDTDRADELIQRYHPGAQVMSRRDAGSDA